MNFNDSDLVKQSLKMETKNNSKNNDNMSFNAIYEQAINESLLIFGEQIATVISLHIKERCSITNLGDTVENQNSLGCIRISTKWWNRIS